MTRVCMVTSSGKCGIGRYASFLAEEIRKVGGVNLFTVRQLPVKGINDLIRLISDVVELNPDVVHVQFDYPFFGSHGQLFPLFVLGVKIASRIRHGKYPRFVVSLHEIDSERGVKSIKGRVYVKLFNLFLARFVDVLVVLSRLARKELLSTSSFTKFREKVHFIPHGSTRIRKMNKRRFEQKYGLEGFKRRGDLVLGMLGFICWEKGHDILLKAIERLRNVKLVVAGMPRLAEHKPYYEELLDYSKRLAGSVRFIGFIEDKDIPSFFDYVDALVLPYRRIRQSGVLNLALAHGVPVIASDLPEFREVERYGCVLLFKKENHLDLARKIRLISSRRVRMNLARNAEKYYRDNSLTRVAKSYVSLYKIAHRRLTNFDLYGNEKIGWILR